jgi:hypothetical protein
MSAVVSAPKPGGGSDEPFTWESPTVKVEVEGPKDKDGKRTTTVVPWSVTIPSLTKLPRPNQMTMLRLQKADKSGVDATDYMLRNGLGDEVMERFEDLPGEEMDQLLEEWADHSGISLGEYRASSASPGSSGRR